MDLQKIKSIQLSLMKKDTDINKNNKAEYTKYATAKFEIPENFFENENDKESLLESLIKAIFDDLISQETIKCDSVGLWIDYDGAIIENAISLNTLNDIKEYSKEEITPIFEFFKMTLE